MTTCFDRILIFHLHTLNETDSTGVVRALPWSTTRERRVNKTEDSAFETEVTKAPSFPGLFDGMIRAIVTVVEAAYYAVLSAAHDLTPEQRQCILVSS